MSITKAVFCTTLVLATTGCMTTGGAMDADARFEAGWRPSKGYCAFGAETPAVGAYCAELNFGADGLQQMARAINQEVLERNGGDELVCTEHVAQVRKELAAYPQYTLTDLYSCDANPKVEGGRAVCHVSLMVTGVDGSKIVVDNGHVLNPAITGGVASHAEFAQLVDHVWTGEQPAWVALASAAK